ncbi:hypothetical protein [Jannaschia aquimarina]|nr:hypothetical protein [Jannaschia aquimarina]
MTIPLWLMLLLVVGLGSAVVAWLLPREGTGPAHEWVEKLGLDHLPRPISAVSVTIWGVLFALFLYGLVWLLIDLAARDQGNMRDFRTSLLAVAAMVAGVSGLVAFPLTLIRTRQGERQTYAREQDLVTDRINKAVENLGAEKTVRRHRKNSKGVLLYEDGEDKKPDFKKPIITEETVPNLEVRIGGLFALDRIARENLGFHVQIMQIL